MSEKKTINNQILEKSHEIKQEEWLTRESFESHEKHLKKEQFISYRGKGLSFDAISKELNISKKTLIKWSKQFKMEIFNCKALEKDRIIAEFIVAKEIRLKHLLSQSDAIDKELSKNGIFEGVNPIQLIDSKLKLIDAIKKEEEEPILFRERTKSSYVGDKEWVAL